MLTLSSDNYSRELLATMCFGFLLLVSPISSVEAAKEQWSATHRFEYNLAVRDARIDNRAGDLIVVAGQEGLAQTAYTTKLQPYQYQLGPSVRFFRPKGMGDDEYKKFVTKFSAFLDEMMWRSDSFAKVIVEMSQGLSKTEMQQFTQGDRTALAITPRAQILIDETTGGLAGVADLHRSFRGNKNYVGVRKGPRITDDPGIRAASNLFIPNELLDAFTQMKRWRDGLGAAPSPKQIRIYHDALTSLGHEVSHAIASFRAVQFGDLGAIKGLTDLGLIDPKDRALARNIVQLFEELENSGYVPLEDENIGFELKKNRPITEAVITQELIDSGLGKGPTPLKRRYTYGTLSAPQILNYYKGKTHLKGLPRIPSNMKVAMSVLERKWMESITDNLIKKNLAANRAEAFDHIMAYWGWGSNCS